MRPVCKFRTEHQLVGKDDLSQWKRHHGKNAGDLSREHNFPADMNMSALAPNIFVCNMRCVNAFSDLSVGLFGVFGRRIGSTSIACTRHDFYGAGQSVWFCAALCACDCAAFCAPLRAGRAGVLQER